MKSRRPDTSTLREFVLELAGEVLPTDGHEREPGDATAAVEAMTERDLWRLFRRLEHWVHKARDLIGSRPAGGGNPADDEFTRL